MEPNELTERERLQARSAFEAHRRNLVDDDGARRAFDDLGEIERHAWLAAFKAGKYAAPDMTFIRLEDGKIFDEMPPEATVQDRHIPKGWMLCVPVSFATDLTIRRALVDHFGRVTVVTVGTHVEAMFDGGETFEQKANEKCIEAARNWVRGAKGTVVRARVATTCRGPDHGAFDTTAIELMAKALREREAPVMAVGTSQSIVGHTLIGTDRIEHLREHTALDVDLWITDETAGFACNNSMLCAGVTGKIRATDGLLETIFEAEVVSISLVKPENAYPGHAMVRPVGQLT